MTPSIDHASARRILELADESAARGGSRSRALAIFFLIALLAAHAARSAGFPDSAHSAAMSPAGASSRARESDHMKQLMAIGAAAAMTAGASAQDAVQWRVEDGGNGHWYQLAGSYFVSWVAAHHYAESRGGHLVTLTSAAEQSFAASTAFNSTPSQIDDCWLGAFQDSAAPDYEEPAGGWRWVTGEPWEFSAWRTSTSAPSGPGAFLVATTVPSDGMRWVDGNFPHMPGNCQAFIEWSADCNADGIVDYGQILAGDLTDTNNNNIPDCCENGTPCGCAGDTNNDRSVDGIDLATVLTRWGQPGAKFPAADCNNDGAIDGTDLAIVLAGWGGCA